MSKKSVMSSLGLKKTPTVRKVPYELPDVFDDLDDWKQIAKILFKENMDELTNTGKILLDEAFWRSNDKMVKKVQSALDENTKPFCGRKAYLGQIALEKGLLANRGDDQFNEGMENIMLFVITFKSKEFIPQDLQEYIDQKLKEKSVISVPEDKPGLDPIDIIIEEYINDPEKFYPTLPVFAKAVAPTIFNMMQGAANQVMDSAFDENGNSVYNPELPKTRISNDDLVMILIGGTIYGKKAKSMWLDDVAYILPEGDEE